MDSFVFSQKIQNFFHSSNILNNEANIAIVLYMLLPRLSIVSGSPSPLYLVSFNPFFPSSVFLRRWVEGIPSQLGNWQLVEVHELSFPERRECDQRVFVCNG